MTTSPLDVLEWRVRDAQNASKLWARLKRATLEQLEIQLQDILSDIAALLPYRSPKTSELQRETEALITDLHSVIDSKAQPSQRVTESVTEGASDQLVIDTASDSDDSCEDCCVPPGCLDWKPDFVPWKPGSTERHFG